MLGKVNEAYRFWIGPKLASGLLATGIASGDFDITVRNPGNTATMAAPAVTEVAGTGLYFFDILAAFSLAHGAGNYGVHIEVDSVAPAVADTFFETIEFHASDLDDVGWDALQSAHLASGTMGRAQLLAHYENAIWIDTGNGAAGAVLGVNGAPDNPVDNLADAVTLAAGLGVRRYNIRKTSGGPLTLTSSHDDWQFIAIGNEVTVALANQDVDGSLFVGISLSGQLNGCIKANDCFLDGVTELDGHFNECHLQGNLTILSGASILFDRCTSDVAGAIATPIIDLQAAHLADIALQFRNYSGGIELRNMDRAGDTASLDVLAGQVVLTASCSDGNIAIRGTGDFTDDSDGSTVQNNGFVNKDDMTQVIWDRQLRGNTHNIQTSAGRRLRELSDANILHTGQFQAGSTVNALALDLGASVIDDFYPSLVIVIVEGPAAGQMRIISDYDGATQIASVSPDLRTAPPGAGDEFEIIALGPAHAATAAPGYTDAAVWIDTNIVNTGTRDFIDGTADNPVSTITAAKVIADSVGLRTFRLLPGSAVTLVEAMQSFAFRCVRYSIDLNGQDISGSSFSNGAITGVGVGTEPEFIGCDFEAVTLPPCTMRSCSLRGMFTMGSAGDYFFDKCFSAVAGIATPALTFIANANANMRAYSGGMQIEAMAATNNMSLEGDGQFIEGTCTGGTVALRGNFEISGVTNVTLANTVPSQYDLRQAWSRRATPTSEMRAIVHLESKGERLTLPGGAACTFQGYDRAGAAIVAFVGAGTLRTVGTDTYFDLSVAYSPTAGEVITVRATITGSGVNGGVHNGFTSISFPGF